MAPRAFRARSCLALVICTVLSLANDRAAAETPVETMPVDQIRPGQTGYGLTVFSGFKIERFKVRVIAVMKNFLPKQDIILMKIDHPRLRQTNVVGGMSGSPIFIDGKLVGALAYGWRFAKEPIAGITPIGNMLGMLKRRLRGPEKLASAAWRRRPLDRLALRSLSRRDRFWKVGLPRRPRADASRRGGAARAALTRVSVPLNVAGLAPETFVDVRQAFGRYGFEPVQGGGTGRAEGPTSFKPGGAIGMQLVSGDVSMAGTGTVTWVRGKDVLAFGHSAFNAGEIYLPAVSARINHTLANVARSFKLSTPARVLGALVQDRQPAIQVDTSRRLSTVPMTVVARGQGQTHTYKVQLARHRLLTSSLASMVLSSALSEALSDVDHATWNMETRITSKGLPQLKIRDTGYSPAGVRRAAVFSSRGLSALGVLLRNNYERVEIERVDVKLDEAFGGHAVQIVGLRVGSNFVAAGARVNLRVVFRPYAGPEFEKTYPIEIPSSLAGSVLTLEAASGRAVRPVVAPPRNVRQLVRNLKASYPGRSVVISLYKPSKGVKIGGRVIRDLPPSVLDSLNTASRVHQMSAFKAFTRRVHGTRRVVTGKRQLRIRVKASDND